MISPNRAAVPLSSLVSFHPLRRLSQILLLSWLLSSSYPLYQMCQKIWQDLPPNMSRINWSHHLCQYHHHHGVELRHLLHLCNLLTGLLLQLLPCYNNILNSEARVNLLAQNSPVALHVTQDQSQNPYNVKPSLQTWPLKTVISSLVTFLLSGLPPHYSPSWASNTLGHTLASGSTDLITIYLEPAFCRDTVLGSIRGTRNKISMISLNNS